MLGHHGHASETPFMAFRWMADDGPLIVIFGSSLSSSSKRTQKSAKVGPPLTKRSGYAYNEASDQHLGIDTSVLKSSIHMGYKNLMHLPVYFNALLKK